MICYCMKFLWNKETIVLIARRQWGKTTMIKKIVKNISRSNIIILDTNNEYQDFPNRIIPREFTSEELDRFLIHCRKNISKLVIVDDIDAYFEGAQATGELKDFLIRASHQDLGLIATLKRPLFVPKLLLSEAVHLLMGGFIFKNDVDYLNSFIKDKGILEKLQRHEFLYRNADTGEEKIMKS